MNDECDEFSAKPPIQVEEKGKFIKQKIFLSYAHKVEGNDDHTADLVDAIQALLQQAGHDAWIDKQQLHPGSDWRDGITKGIVDSDRVLSFLSPRSVRDPGVCLDEIGISMNHKYGAIATLLADSRVVSGIPASVTHVQYLDLSDWQTIKAQGEQPWVQWLDERGATILDIIAKNAGFAGEIYELSKLLSPFPQSGKVGTLIEQGLIGRQWVKDAIDNWRLTQKDQRMFWLKAGPGMGKSALAAHLVHHSKLQAVAYHFCDYGSKESGNAARFVQNLAFMLAARLPDYRRLLRTQLLMLTKQLDQYSADELMSRLIVEPLRNKIDGGQADDRLLVVIDALDEAESELPELLARHLNNMPAWLGFVVTSRPDVENALAGFPAFDLEMDDIYNTEDLRAYLQDWQRSQPDASLDEKTQASLLKASEGSILYLVMARKGYQSTPKLFDLSDLSQLPRGITGVYGAWMRRQFEKSDQDHASWNSLCHPLLELLCATPLPVPVGTAAGLLGWKGQNQYHALDPLGSLVTMEAGNLRLCHRSFGEWLADYSSAKKYWVNMKDARLTLAQALLKRLPASLNASEPGYGHLVLPQLLVNIDDDFCSQLSPTEWQELIDNLKDLDNFLQNFYTRSVFDRQVDLRRWLVKQHQLHLDVDNPDTLNSMENLACTLKERLDLSGELDLQELILTQRVKNLTQDHPDTLRTMQRLVELYGVLHGKEAARLIMDARLTNAQIRKGYVWSDLSLCYLDVSESNGDDGSKYEAPSELPDDAVRLKQLLTRNRAALGAYHPDTLRLVGPLIEAQIREGDHMGAKETSDQLLQLGVDREDTLWAVRCIQGSLMLEFDGEPWEVAFNEQVLTLCRNAFGEDHEKTLESIENLLSAMERRGYEASAKTLDVHFNEVTARKVDETRSIYGGGLSNPAEILLKRGNDVQARQFRQLKQEECSLLRERWVNLQDSLGKEDPQTLKAIENLANTLSGYAEILRNAGLLTEAEPLQREALLNYIYAHGQDSVEAASAYSALGALLVLKGEAEEAKQNFQLALAIREAELGTDDPATILDRKRLNNLSDLWGKPEQWDE